MRKQDLSVLLMYYAGFTSVRNRILWRRGERLVRFVTFHDVAPDHAEGFAAMLRYLRRTTNVISIDDYFAGLLAANRINVVITFDDGSKNWCTIAAPVLKELRLAATFFVTSGFIAGAEGGDRVKLHRDAVGGATERLTESGVEALARAGFTIGGHTLSHVNLVAMEDERELAREIAADRHILQAITGTEVKYFAYPFGAYRNPRVDLVALLKDAGYQGAVTTVSGFNVRGMNPYLLHRELTGLPMSVPVFAARVNGACDGVEFLKTKLDALLGRRAAAV